MDAGNPPTGTLCNTCTMSSDCGTGNYCLFNNMTGSISAASRARLRRVRRRTPASRIAAGTGSIMQCVPTKRHVCTDDGLFAGVCGGADVFGRGLRRGRTDAGSMGTDAGGCRRLDSQMLAAINAAAGWRASVRNQG